MDAVSFNPTSPPLEHGETSPALQTGTAHKDYAPLYKRFEVRESQRADKDFSTIWDWAKGQSPAEDPDAILWEVTKLSQRIGNPGYGQIPWSKLLNYITTFNQMRSAEGRLKEMDSSM